MMHKIVSLIALCLAPAIIGYTTYDNKVVPELPAPGNVIQVNDVVSFYMALRNQTSGQIIVMAAGRYDCGNIEPMNITANGFSIRGATDDPADVVITGKGFDNCVNVEEEMFMLYANKVTVANLTISESRCHGFKFQGGNNDHTILHNVRFLNIGERMVKGPATLDAVQCSIRYCHFEATKIPAITRCGSSATDSDGNYIAGMDLMRANSWVIHDNVFLNIKGPTGGGRGAIFFWHLCENMITERNTFIGCDRSICYGNPHNPDNEIHVIKGIIRNNMIAPGATNGLELYFCSGIKVWNNTSYSKWAGSGAFIGTDNDSLEIKNNIIFGALNVTGAAFDTARNIVMTRTQRNLAANWFNSDESHGDLHLINDTCRPVNAGLVLSGVIDDWDGLPRSGSNDIGADEISNNSGIDLNSETPHGLYVSGSQPNPGNPSATFKYYIPNTFQGKHFSICVLNSTGNRIRLLRTGNALPGHSSITWDGKDDSGSITGSGVYLLQVRVGNLIKVKQSVIIK
ncbi:MAG: hypothetical protein A2519_13740 [Candidatus Raymondbacteria bacterium RIFOXYD12_FULL_49_13]|uniref:FlgD Ig-like domain-containing protein n=1 Tax=Candidatus Raymondbacteria bacterium RIFOXYD12_FULL_49_13 TaxID=1817890 RepID=A0A1F7FK40_UNCRA|nr:MAG: hypothetical protein A2519_13740 [Candidatus Raymondbacteria bacterium RIFOXYD12_FULL_49_13]